MIILRCMIVCMSVRTSYLCMIYDCMGTNDELCLNSKCHGYQSLKKHDAVMTRELFIRCLLAVICVPQVFFSDPALACSSSSVFPNWLEVGNFSWLEHPSNDPGALAAVC